MNPIKQITAYFREAVKAKACGAIDPSEKDKCWTITPEEYQSGCLNQKTTNQIIASQSTDTTQPDCVDVLLIPKTLGKLTDEEGIEIARNLKDITGLYFIPAKLSCLGHLYIVPAEGKRPWIPRELLHPMVEPQLCIGTVQQYTQAQKSNLSGYALIETWQAYRQYAEAFYESVTGTPFEENTLLTGLGENGKTRTARLNDTIYVCIHTAAYITQHLLQLYNELIDDTNPKPLYEKFLSGEKNTLPLLPGEALALMEAHAGQMNCRYPLSATQREALNHFRQTGLGEILAVSGPPGTGKTTLLQSVVADLLVGRALAQKQAPLIVASSTNNQAVTNIIRSFGAVRRTEKNAGAPEAEAETKTKAKTEPTKSLLEQRWICGVDSLAVYFPSDNKVEQAEKAGFQCTTRKANHFAAAIETTDNLEASEKRMLEKCSAYFHRSFLGIDACQTALHKELKMIDHTRRKCLATFDTLQTLTGGLSADAYRGQLRAAQQEIAQAIHDTEACITGCFEQIEAYKNRMKTWRACYESLPWLIRKLSFLPGVGRKIQAVFRTEKTPEELDFLPAEPSLDEILEAYSYRIQQANEQINHYRRQMENCRVRQARSQKEEQKLNALMAACEAQFAVLANYNPELFYPAENETAEETPKEITAKTTGETRKKTTTKKAPWQRQIAESDRSAWNASLDTTARYIAFWLAVHYYECEWLKKKDILTDSQRGYNFQNVLESLYSRLAMVTPCMVMTLYMLPKNFLAYDAQEKKNFHLFNHIDLLIVEEAGQVTPEIAAPAFSLAKRALVIGDENQIPPVWGLTGALDTTLALQYGVIEKKEDFSLLAESGLNCSASNSMKVAKNACKYKGLFLSEHRRCYNEIIAFCNQLIYKEQLQPKRGNGKEDTTYPLPGLPQMGYKNISAEHAAQAGVSRYNEAEARAIVAWLKARYPAIRQAYQDSDRRLKPDEILAVITPFKAQAQLIRSYIAKEMPRERTFITVGTVHTFQGAERKIILFSTVYGAKDSGYFIERNPNLVNVAVSRAQDSFLIFGARDGLHGEVGRLLKSHTPEALTF